MPASTAVPPAPRTDAPEAPPPRPREEPGSRSLREEVQALRALAVALVVATHFWPEAVPGGFVGVDVFFVISGFLITGLLLREHGRDGRVSLLAFWARRARRLLPAALLVVGACLAVTVAAVPVTHWDQFLGDMRASVLYIENWHLAERSVDYFAADDGPSPVQHFWTLSVEEQFYVAWPLLLVAALWVGRRAGRLAVGGLLGVVAAASLAYGIHLTLENPTLAYFSTPARAWEFAAGGLLALLPAVAAPRPRVRAALSWLGLGAIVLAAFLYSSGTAFPGWAALLPVAGALAVIRAGMPSSRLSPAPLYALRPVQGLGLLSYSVYLWHWPLLVLTPYVIGREVDAALAGGLAAATLLLSWVTLRLVEDPFRTGRLLRARRPRATYALAASAMAVVVAATLVAADRRDQEFVADRQESAATLADPPECFGAPARDPDRRCDNPGLARTAVPTPLEAAEAGNSPCTITERSGRHVHVCAFGARPPVRPSRTVAIVGDSHAASWRAALGPVARARGWRGLSITRSGCPFTAATRDVDEPARSRCSRWNREVLEWFRRNPRVDTVFVVSRSGLEVEAGGDDPRQVAAEGYADAWRALPDSVERVVVLRDNPQVRGDTLDCVARALDEGKAPATECAVPRERALERDPQVAAARRVEREVHTVDLTELFCDRQACYPVIGGALAYRDESHLTATFAETMAPRLGRELSRILGPSPRKAEIVPARAPQRNASPSERSQSPSVDRTA